MAYFVIYNSEGDTHVEEVERIKLLERILQQYYGDVRFIENLSKVDKDTNYWGDNILIIKGEIVPPVAVQVTTKFDIA